MAADMLTTRILTAAVGIPLVALVIWAGGWWLAGVVAAAAGIAVLELQAARGTLRTPMVALAGALAVALPVAAKLGGPWPDRTLTAVALAPAALLALRRDPRKEVEDWLWAVATVVYVGWLASRFVLLREWGDGREWVLLAVLTVWITDTGAYFVGKNLGRRKMAPAVSPNKTWEGAAGGQLAGLAAVVGLHYAFDLGLDWYHVAALGLLLPVAAQAGDLAESAIKRALGIKDASTIVPGHGGIADRLDSLLFAIPSLYYYLQWLVW